MLFTTKFVRIGNAFFLAALIAVVMANRQLGWWPERSGLGLTVSAALLPLGIFQIAFVMKACVGTAVNVSLLSFAVTIALGVIEVSYFAMLGTALIGCYLWWVASKLK